MVNLWQCESLARLSWLRHGVTRRGGGISTGPYSSLNLGLHVGDEPDAVLENRRRAAESLGLPLSAMVCAAQVHGGVAEAVDASDAGRGAIEHADSIPDADALVTATPGLLLALFYADCVPVLLADPERRVIAVAHAGWRGLAANVIGNTVTVMRERFGAEPSALLAAVGPCIGPCCYEVGTEVAEAFPEETHTIPGQPRPHVDLAQAAARHLRAAGVPAGSITVSGECTACLPGHYFSHRGDNGKTGRIAALMAIAAGAE